MLEGKEGKERIKRRAASPTYKTFDAVLEASADLLLRIVTRGEKRGKQV